MNEEKKFENFPLSIVFITNFFNLILYVSGFFIIIRIGLTFSILYLLFILISEYRIIRFHCIDCFYWGKRCGFGKGRISSLFFKKGEESKFCGKQMTWKDIIPDLLVPLVPLVVGVVLLFMEFDFVLVLLIMSLVILSTFGNAFIRGALTCKFCKQKEFGCPADQLFNKK